MNSRSQRRANQKRPANALLALLLAVCLFGTLTLPVFAQDGEGVSLQQAEPASTVETAAPDDGQGPDEETPTQTGDPAALQGETDETEQTDETEPAAPQDGTEQTDETEPADPATPETAQPGDTVALQQVMNFAQGDLTVQVSIEGDAVVAEAPLAEPAQAERIDAQNVEPVQAYARSAANVATAENAAQETPADQATLQVAVLPQSEPEYQQARDYLRENGSEDVLSLSAMRLDFYYQDQPLDVSPCTVTLTIDAGDTLVQQARQVAAEADAAQDAKVGVEFVALQSRNGQAEKLQSAFVDGDADQAPQLDVTLTGAQPVLMVARSESTNPTFTVQYYAYLEVTEKSNDGYLKIIDTSDDGDGDGGNLPKNGENPKQTSLFLKDVGGGKREVRTSQKLTELYSENRYKYFDAPGLPYVNIFRENGNYKATAVWVLTGDDPNSTDEKDWRVIPVTDPSQILLTNNASYAGQENVIVIKEDTVLRLVAEQTESPYENDATFYDYDITDDGKTTQDAAGAHGINIGSNYKGSGAKLAFGNANTGTGLELQNWNGNYLNQYNKKLDPDGSTPTDDDGKPVITPLGYLGCTFGLVTGLDADGHIQYASGVDAPALFDDGTAEGKTVLEDWSLGFNRVGDTYTLTSVKDNKDVEQLTGLEYFNNPETNGVPYTNIWTNNFWPMDNITGTDDKTGAFGGYYKDEYGNVTTSPHSSEKYTSNGKDTYYPPSDDGIAHNNMFGMQYEVKFKLTEDYVGPLEYYFFGDDDMWVFLDGRLVCDIGGVHSSVGAYVNLWDYIKKGDAGEHTLKFYYTERGLSGSTCYMQFTLPSVSSVEPEYQNAQLKIMKTVQGNADPDEVFDFSISITGANGVPPKADYSIERFTAGGTKIESTLLQGGKGTFSLKATEYAIIRFLQYGTKYTISETACPGYTVTTIVDERVDEEPAIIEENKTWTAGGTVQEGNNSSIEFINKVRPKLPNTGGNGTALYTLGGGTLLAFALWYATRRKKAGASRL